MALISLTGLPGRRSGAEALNIDPPKTSAAESKTTKAIDSLTKFIPTELLAPYVAALSAADSQRWNVFWIYIIFVIATPFAYLLFEFARKAAEDSETPSPVLLGWRSVAATGAFALWGLAAPTNNLQEMIGGPLVAGAFAMGISPVLTAVDTIILKKSGYLKK